MKKTKQLVSLLLVLAMLSSLMWVPTAAQTATAVDIICQMDGNTGAVITVPSGAKATTDSSLVTLSQSGNTVTVTAVDGASGIADVAVSCGGTVKSFSIPVGYTTFVFDGDKLTVIPGTDDKYEIAGINAANEEYLVDSTDANYVLPYTLDADGNQVFENTDSYSINVGIKKKGGNYVFYGHSDDMSVCVKKEATVAAYLYLCGLQLSSSFTSPVTVKKNSTTQAYIMACEGFYNILSDCDFNNADLYGDTADGGDGTNVEYAESSCIKGKDYADITIGGKGIIELNCVTKNAIKVNDYGNLTIEDVTLYIDSALHGISSDNTMTINSGNINVIAAEDGIRCDPASVDSTLGLASILTVNGGYITVDAGYDAIQSAQDIYINGGVFNITAGGGYNSSSFNADTMSCKGIKASYNGEDADSVDTTTLTQHLQITGGIFSLNTADDALHTDAYITITGGDFDIATSDDGIHSDTTLILGEEGGDNSKVRVNISTCYEGIESGTVNFYSGTYDVLATNDGVNSAGGSDSSSDTGTGGGFNPGGSRPGQNNNSGSTTTTGSFALNVYGGDLFINVSNGDGLDSNGTMTLSGGNIEVWGAPTGQDGEPVDGDGTKTISGATVFGAGTSMMSSSYSGSQTVKTSNTSISAGNTINVKNGSTTVFNRTALKNVSYVLYSSPSAASSWTISADTSALIDSHTHSYTTTESIEATCVLPGFTSYACTGCNAVYTETTEAAGHVMDSYCTSGCGKFDPESFSTSDDGDTTVYYTLTFDADGGSISGDSTYSIAAGQRYSEVISSMPSATKENYTLDGWYNAQYGYTLVLTDTFSYNANLTFTAVWTPADALYSTGSYTTTASWLTVRSGPGTTYSALGSLASGTVVEITEVVDKWGRFSNDTYTDGWISLAYAEAVEDHTHSYTSTVTKAATCTTAGVRTYTCTCADSYTEAITATGHSYTSVTTVPTCTEAGYTTYTCTVCDDTYIADETDALGHTWGEWIETKAPTYTETGVETRTCGTCGATETQDVPMLEAPAEGQPAVLDTTNYTVTLSGITDVKEIRFAPGHWTTGTEVRNAEGTLTLSASLVAANTNENGVFTYDVAYAREYTFWVRMNDGTGYFLYADTSEINTYLVSDGLRLTVTDMKEASLIKDMWIAEGTWTSYAEIKNNVAAGAKYQATNVKLANYFATNDFTYTTANPGAHTVLIRYNDGTAEYHHIDLTVDVPTFDVNGLQVTVGNIPGIKIIRTAYGEYNSVSEIKSASGVRNFNNKTAIKDAETYMIQYRDSGTVTVIVEYNTGYKHVEHINIQQKTPTFTQDGNTVTFGNLDGLVIVRYAPGKYTTSNGIKNAEGSKYVKPESVVDGKIVIEDLAAGTYTFCVQYDDESYNFYTVTVE